ncbi:sigma-54-dependent Fis family transcriptional regulator [bacterium]|nr:sigma-54-dependent Fis family transcriptional regulator [bacterium]
MKDIKGIFNTSAALAGVLSLDELLRLLMDTAAEITGAEAGSVLLLDRLSGDLIFTIATGKEGAKLSDTRLKSGEGIAGWVARTGKSAMVNDVVSDDRHTATTDNLSGFLTKSVLAVPMLSGENILGVIEAVNKKRGFFEDADLNALNAFAGFASVAISNARKFENLTLQNKELRQQAYGKWNLIGGSRQISTIRDLINRVAPTSTSVLITGESGTGKEVVAHQIHENSSRPGGPFVKVSCAAIPETLLESELFGHERGAFTGATERRIGRFEAAGGGTILLDEIGEISYSVQTKLLRFLQEKEFERLGSGRTISSDVRVIAATNRDLVKSVEKGIFREDLYYRLKVFPIEMPPLRGHPEDIPILTEYFIERLSDDFPHTVKSVDEKAMEILVSYSWPGNVRELENLIERCAVIAISDLITVSMLPPELSKSEVSDSISSNNGLSLEMTLPQIEELLIRHALEVTGGNVSKTARMLDISRDKLRYRLKTFTIETEDYRRF